MKFLNRNLVSLVAIVSVIASALIIAQAQTGTKDPDPRILYLGRESINQPDDLRAAPAFVYFYKDKATGQEVMCFTGRLRETLSCLQTSRNRGKE